MFYTPGTFCDNQITNFKELLVDFDPKSEPESTERDRRRPPKVTLYQIFITGVPNLNSQLSSLNSLFSILYDVYSPPARGLPIHC